MKRDEVLEKLKASETELRAQGVAHAALFGSVARGEERAESDIDIMIELDPAAHIDMFAYVINRDGLKPHVRPNATADAIYAF